MRLLRVRFYCRVRYGRLSLSRKKTTCVNKGIITMYTQQVQQSLYTRLHLLYEFCDKMTNILGISRKYKEKLFANILKTLKVASCQI